MILTALANYYEQLLREHPDEVAEQGWSRVKISHLLVISEAGELVDIIPAPDKNGWMKRVPERVKRSSGIAPNLLADNSSYLLGIDNKGKPDRSKRCFEAARQAHLEAFSQVNSAAARSLCAFFASWDPDGAASDEAVSRAGDSPLAGGNLSFLFDGCDIGSDPMIEGAWDALCQTADDDEMARCLVTGQVGPIARLHPALKGIVGAKATASLVSFNASAFESYGHDGGQGLNAPTGKRVAFAYGEAFNFLSRDPYHHVRVGDTTVVYWAERGDEAAASLMGLLLGSAPSRTGGLADETSTKELDAAMRFLAHGELPNVDELDLSAGFYVLGIAPNSARLSVRLFERSEFGTVLGNVRRHYERLEIAHSDRDARLLTPYWLLKAADNPRAKDTVVTSELGGELLRSILTDTRYPESLYAHVLLRVRATHDDADAHVVRVNRERAALIKAYLIKNAHIYKEGTMETLDLGREELPYVLGRLFWTLEDLQHTVSPDINATISDKYFDAACATPSLVFPTLLKLEQQHLRKLKRDKPGLAHNIDARVTELLAKVDGFPSSLTAVQQGDFILGYYHQKNFDFQERQERARAKREQVSSNSVQLAE